MSSKHMSELFTKLAQKKNPICLEKKLAKKKLEIHFEITYLCIQIVDREN